MQDRPTVHCVTLAFIPDDAEECPIGIDANYGDVGLEEVSSPSYQAHLAGTTFPTCLCMESEVTH